MTRFEGLARRLALVLGLLGAGGCGEGTSSAGTPSGYPPPPPPPPAQAATPQELVADVNTHLAHLRALKVVAVSRVVLDAPGAYACYGMPCAGAESNPAMAAEYARQAPRLARLTEAAQRAAGASEVAPANPAAADADLAALNRLRIVEVAGLLTVGPQANPSCYSLPCPEDIARAGAENERLAGVLHAWAGEAAALEDGAP